MLRCCKQRAAARPARARRRVTVTVAMLGAVLSAAWLTGRAATHSVPPEIPFDSVPDFFKMPPDLYFGEVAGIAVNSHHHIFVFTRGNSTGPAYGAAAAQLLEFDPNGNFLREIGHDLYAWSFAHSVRIDPQDNIWTADKGSDVVVKFTPAGRVSMVFGRKAEASDENAHPLAHPHPPLPPIDGMFRQVTDMTWDTSGNIYISDGYINSRVAKYDRDGNWVGSFGEPGSAPGQLNTPHSIAIDHENRIYVADRGNRRIQVFDTSGKVLSIIHIDVPVPPDAPSAIYSRPKLGPGGSASGVGDQTMQPGAPWTLCITPGPTQYIYVSDAFPGRIYKLSLDGKVLGWLGGSGRVLKKFGWIHAIACPSENELYVGELLNWRAQKLILHPR
jgi:DNA-binding beta-propeller fold protein YncE